jgi:hypothetical protein
MNGLTELESASFRAEALAAHAALIGLAAEGLTADGDDINGRKFQAGAEALEEQLTALSVELKRLSEVWRLERSPPTH